MIYARLRMFGTRWVVMLGRTRVPAAFGLVLALPAHGGDGDAIDRAVMELSRDVARVLARSIAPGQRADR